MKKSILRYIPIAEYVIGCCHYGHHGKPFKTVAVKADSLSEAMFKGARLLEPTIAQSICHIETRPNPNYKA